MNEHVYISGPISNRPEKEVTAHFSEAALYLLKKGFFAQDPSQILIYKDDFFFGLHFSEKIKSEPWEYFMRQGIILLMKCDRIYMLEGWEKSRGAKIEYNLARDLGMKIMYEKEGDLYEKCNEN
jgi:hypothetical protein